MQEERERLSVGQVAFHAHEAIHGDRDPSHARAIFAEFVACVDNNEEIPERLLEFLRDAFTSYLAACAETASPTPEQFAHAFGLLRNRSGRPEGDGNRSLTIAITMLRERLAGATYEQSWTRAMERWNCSRNTATSAFAARKLDALLHIRLLKAMDGACWSDDEARTLSLIFDKDREAIRFLEKTP